MEHTPISPEEAADRLAIRELVDAYAHCADRRDELSTQSETFRTRWATHNVRFHDQGTHDSTALAKPKRVGCSKVEHETGRLMPFRRSSSGQPGGCSR